MQSFFLPLCWRGNRYVKLLILSNISVIGWNKSIWTTAFFNESKLKSAITTISYSHYLIWKVLRRSQSNSVFSTKSRSLKVKKNDLDLIIVVDSPFRAFRLSYFHLVHLFRSTDLKTIYHFNGIQYTIRRYIWIDVNITRSFRLHAMQETNIKSFTTREFKELMSKIAFLW